MRVFIVRKLKFNFILKLVLSIAFLFLISKLFSRNHPKESTIDETIPPKIITQTHKEVVRKEGMYFHMFGEENEINLDIVSIWELLNVKIKYYVAYTHDANLTRFRTNSQNITYYNGRKQRSLKRDISMIDEHERNKGQWHIILNPTVMVNRTAILNEVSKYKWHYPVLLTFSIEAAVTDENILDSYNYEAIILSASMFEMLHGTRDLGIDGLRKHWTRHYIDINAYVMDPVCLHIGEQDCSTLQNSIIYKVSSLGLLPHVVLILIRSEKRHKPPLLADMARKYGTSLTKIPHKYLHEARELYDREMEWGTLETGRWKRMDLPQECSELRSLNRGNCYLTCLVEESMPISGHMDRREWRIIRAYTQFSLEGGEEYLVWLEKRGGYNFLFRFMNALDMKSGGELMRFMKQRKLFLIHDPSTDSEEILNRYQELLREQEVHLTTTRHPLLFSINLILSLGEYSEEKLTQHLNIIKAEFPEIEAWIWNGEITSSNLMRIFSHLEANDVLAVNILDKKLNYQTIERCFSLTSLELQLLFDSEREICVAVGDMIRGLKFDSKYLSPLNSISELFSDMKIMRIPLSI